CTRTTRRRAAEVGPVRRRRCGGRRAAGRASPRRIRLGNPDPRIERRRPNRRSARRLSTGLRLAVRSLARTVPTRRPPPPPASPPPAPVRPIATLQSAVAAGGMEDLAALAKLVDRWPLVTIVGPGGVGKPTLAREVTRRRAPAHSGGVKVIELAAVTAASAVA